MGLVLAALLGALMALSPGLIGQVLVRGLLFLALACVVWCFARGDVTSGLLVAVAAGLAQGVLANLDPSPVALLADDIAVAVLIVGALTASLGRVWPTVAATAAGATLALGLAQASSSSLGLLQARQIGVAIGLMFVGARYRRRIAWDRFTRSIVLLGIVCTAYSCLELLEIRFLDPLALLKTAEFRGGRIADGLPAYYFTSVPSLGVVRRSGSLFLNPPTAGLFVGTALALLPVARVRHARTVALTLCLGLALTVSKGGIVVAGLAYGLIWSRRFIGKTLALSLCFAGLLLGSQIVLDSGNNSRHLEGLVVGALGALTSPLGHGFGRIGNLTVLSAQQGVGESLLGLYFYSCGAAALALVAVVVHRLVRTFYRATTPVGATSAAVALAAVVVAALSESATALAASLPLWICVGSSVARRSDA